MSKSEILTKIPPHNKEAEQSLLGALFIDKDAIIKIADSFTPEEFYSKKHATIYEAILELYSRQEPIDILSVANRLEEKNILLQIGGRAYLSSLAAMVPTAAHIVHYAEIIQKKATLRRLMAASTKIQELAWDEEEDVEDIVDKAEQHLFSVSIHIHRQIFVPIKDVLGSAFERIDEIHHNKGKLRGLGSGFPSLDNYLGGFQKSDLLILAARPSVGKTSLALDFARHSAKRDQTPVALFSLEMSKEILVDRLLCAEARVDLWKMRTGRLGEQDFPKLGEAMGILSELPIYIDDSGTVNVMEIRTKARRLEAEHGLGLIIVDYLQLMEGRRRTDNRVQEISEISRALKQVARELNVPVLALSQLSRAVESRAQAIPKLSDLRESGSIEQDADVVLFIYRKSMDANFRDLPEKERGESEIHIAKHRNRPVGKINLYFNETYSSFSTIAKEGSFMEPGSMIPAHVPDIEF